MMQDKSRIKRQDSRELKARLNTYVHELQSAQASKQALRKRSQTVGMDASAQNLNEPMRSYQTGTMMNEKSHLLSNSSKH